MIEWLFSPPVASHIATYCAAIMFVLMVWLAITGIINRARENDEKNKLK